MKFIRIGVLLLGLSASAVAYAIAPVVDAYNDGDSDDTPSSASHTTNTNNPAANAAADNPRSFSLEQRLSIQEHQISNLNPLLVQADDLTQKMQNMQGKLEEQEHRLKRLEEQVRRQYQDLERRFSQRQTPLPAAAAVNSPAATHPPLTADKNPLTNAIPRPQAASSSLPTAAGERAYQTAFQLLKNKQYVPAIEGFEDFVKKYPADINLPNANYFLGQLYLLQGQPEQSITRFNRFVSIYAQDARIPDALLQLGLAYFAKGEKKTAMDTFKKIIQRYPDTKAAQSAQARLQQFQAMISAADMSTKNKA